MAGYGGADDHLGAQEAHIEDSLALQQLKNAGRNNNPTGCCLECGDDIPALRLIAIPNADHCVQCQQDLDHAGKTHNKFQVRNHYVP